MNLQFIIEDYIKSETSNGAILINGEWGWGKSHYWREFLVPLVEQIHVPYKNKKYKCLYVSLNGVATIGEVVNRLVLAKLPWIKSKTAKITMSLGGAVFDTVGKIPYFSSKAGQHSTKVFEKFKLIDFLDFSDNVICFDDLERTSEKLTVSEVMGFVNINFVEVSKIKTVMIANEKEIPKNDVYSRIKEKTIFRVVHFDTGLVPVKEIFKRYKSHDKFQKFLNGQADEIEQIIQQYGKRNLRTLIFSLDILKGLFQNRPALFESEEAGKSLAHFTLIFSTEFKNGALTSQDAEDCKDLDKILNENFRTSILVKSIQRARRAKDAPSNEDSYAWRFYNKYQLSDYEYFFFFKSIYIYILSGVLDLTLLDSDLEEFGNFQKERERQKAIPEIEAYWRLQRINTISSDEELRDIQTKVLSFAERGKFDFWEYGNLYDLFSNLEDNRLLFENFDSVKTKLIEGCKISIAECKIPPAEASFINRHLKLQNWDAIGELIKEKLDALEIISKDDEVYEFFAALQGDKQKFIDGRYYYFNIFDRLTASEIFGRIRDFDLNALRNFESYLGGRLSDENLGTAYVGRREEFENLARLIEEIANSSGDLLKSFTMRNIVRQLDQVSDKLSN